MSVDVLTHSEFPDVTSGNAFGLHAIYSGGKRFETVIMGTITRVNDSTKEWEMTLNANREAITSPESGSAGAMAYLEEQSKKLTPMDQHPSYPGRSSGEPSREDKDTEDPEQLEDILNHWSDEPPEWLLRQKEDERVELLNTTPVVPLDPAKGSGPKYHELTSHGEVAQFVSGEIILPKQFFPEWVSDDLYEIDTGEYFYR